MPKNSSDDSVEQRPEEYSQSHWSEIGIHAVAAASICKSYDRTRRDHDAGQTHFPFAGPDFATD